MIFVVVLELTNSAIGLFVNNLIRKKLLILPLPQDLFIYLKPSFEDQMLPILLNADVLQVGYLIKDKQCFHKPLTNSFPWICDSITL